MAKGTVHQQLGSEVLYDMYDAVKGKECVPSVLGSPGYTSVGRILDKIVGQRYTSTIANSLLRTCRG